jgi:hypothetical protein
MKTQEAKDDTVKHFRLRERLLIMWTSHPWRIISLSVVTILSIFLFSLVFSRPTLNISTHCPEILKIVTWNIAAINNNPFEYWVTHQDPEYNRLMEHVQAVMDSPGEYDMEVEKILTNAMFQELYEDMKAAGIDIKGAELSERWHKDLSKRKAISGFLTDHSLGKKRLASMPDRVTNTIQKAEGGVLLRPTAVNCFDGALDSIPDWWRQWRNFMFRTPVRVHGSGEPKMVYKLLAPIPRAKYPALTAEEEAMSVPLQVSLLQPASFDEYAHFLRKQHL